jgi:hypothetical protein
VKRACIFRGKGFQSAASTLKDLMRGAAFALRYLTGAVALSSSVPPFVSVRGNRPIRSACC